MPISHVGSSQASTGATGGTSTSLAITRPASQSGDFGLMYVMLTGTNVTANATAPGWTLVDSDVDTGSPSARSHLFKRVFNGTSADDAVISWTGGGEAVAAMSVYRGVDDAAVIGQTDVHAGTATARTTGTLNTAEPSWIVHGFGDRNGSTFTAYDGNLRQEPRIASSASLILIDSNAEVAAGAITRTATASASTSIGGSFIASLVPGEGSLPAPTVSAGADQINIEPWATVTLSAVAS